MSDDRRMTADRFFGGVSNRLENLRAMLAYVQDEQPSRDELNEWLRSNTRARSADAVNHHLAFLNSIELITVSTTSSTLAEYGRRYYRDNDPETLYEALSAGVKGFDVILEALNREPMTDEELMELLVREFEDAEMTAPGPAIRHREWLQVLGYVTHSDGTNYLTETGQEFLTRLNTSSSAIDLIDKLPARARIEAAIVAYERISRQADAPGLSSQTGTLSHWHAEQQMLETYPKQFQSSGSIPTARHLDNIVLWAQPVVVSHTREA